MTCEHVREQLWELAIEDFDQLEPHLSTCPECAALAAAIREEAPAVQEGLDAFANAVPFGTAFERATEVEQRAPEAASRRWRMMDQGLHWMAMAMASAAAVSVALYSTVDRGEVAPVEAVAPVEPAGVGGGTALPASVTIDVNQPYTSVEVECRESDYVRKEYFRGGVARLPDVPDEDCIARFKGGPPATSTLRAGYHLVCDFPLGGPPCEMAGEVEVEVDGAEMPLTTAGTGCEDLTALEPSAMLGRLEPETIECLEDRVDVGDEALSSLRLLSVDAFSRGDKDAWEGYTTRLLDMDPTDPDLAYKLALHNGRKGAEFAEDTIAFAEQGLEARRVWTGETYVRRVNNLHKLRASAAQQLWAEAPEDAEARERTIEYAREWLEFTRSADVDEDRAVQLCEVAAGEPC